MTRLINADEIVYEETLRFAGRTRNTSTYYHDYHVWARDIDKMPTVDAIPVKWLEDRRSEIANKLDEVAGVLDLEELAEAYCCQLNTINWLIDSWLERKEE